MFVDDSSSRESVARMVRRMSANVALRQDLQQEALIHLWLAETHRPGQTKSWYLQSCKYHLLHYLASGRSVDSAKRRADRLEMPLEEEARETVISAVDDGDSVFGWVSARDIISLLSARLLPVERTVLDRFAEGLGPREIGRELGMSHTMVIKHRRKMRDLLRRLEVPSLRGTNGVQENGHEANHNLQLRTLRTLNFDYRFSKRNHQLSPMETNSLR